MSKITFTATEKDISDLPPQAKVIVKTARGGATKERILKALSVSESKQKPGRVLSYYKQMLVSKGFIKVVEEKEKKKAAKPAKRRAQPAAQATVADAPAPETPAAAPVETVAAPAAP